MVINEREIRKELTADAARRMMTAARTAPKGKGMDIIETAMVTGEDIERLSKEMLQLSDETGLKFVVRDAENLHSADAVVIIGTRAREHGLNCSHCGFKTCKEKPEAIPCVLNMIDVGIAVGSACAAAADVRVDTRVMFSAGLAAQRLGWLEDCKGVIGIPVSVSSKNPFFDRVPKF
ncbi:hypothetical protein Barb7_01424 [Bacteroidales bacterium Barb7]|nr:hypothetical protein Barb7_01424 [Bacteroidales bacterium Barb7]